MTDSLAAGPELDRLVAERVMGWTDEGDGWWRDGQPHLTADVDGVGCATHGNATYEEAIFGPSKRIDHAWAVVEHLQRTLRHFSLFYDETTCEWLCRLDKQRCIEEEARIRVWAETAPLAICRAALAVVMPRTDPTR